MSNLENLALAKKEYNGDLQRLFQDFFSGERQNLVVKKEYKKGLCFFPKLQ